MTKRRVFTLWLLLLSVTIGAVSAAKNIEDPDVRHGVLANSMTYYIRHNEKPKGQADFYILSHVGAIQEEDDQQGLAHFIEHMAFNGTVNMPDKEIIEYLEKIGVKFGANLNASTSWDQTIYMMCDVPTQRNAVVDSALLILHDWAAEIDPHEAEIDKERGVIKEELRTRDNADWRSALSMIATLGRGTKYEHRNLIGTLEGLSQFDPQSLLSFYHDWYRPDHQAIIIVGDVDVDRVEAEILKLFADIPAAAADAPTKEVIRVPENDAPIVSIFTDPELQYSAVYYYFKRTIEPDEELPSREQTIRQLMRVMQSERFDEISMQDDAPIIFGGMQFGRMGVIPTLDLTTYLVQSAEGELDVALNSLVEEMERTRRHGFTQSELERASKTLMRSYQRQYLNRDDRTNSTFVDLYSDNFFYNTPVLSAEQQWLRDSMDLVTITLAEVNDKINELFSDDNNVIIINSPLKEGLDVPSEADVLRVIDSVHKSEIAPPADAEQSGDLISEEVMEQIEAMANQTSITKITNDATLATTEYRLSNGIEVVVKPTALRQDEILMRGYTEGGASLLSDDDYYAGMLISSVMNQSGVGDFTAIELSRHLSGVIASVSSWVTGYTHGVSGNCSPADLEPMMQLLYLTFTNPRFDESAFNVFKRQMLENIENQELSPDYQAANHFSKVAYGDHPRKQLFSTEIVNGLRFEEFASIHRALYSDGDNFRFIFAGNIDMELFEPLMIKYLGALPVASKGKAMSYVDDGVRAVKGEVSARIDVAMEQPKVTVNMLYSGTKIKNTLRNNIIATYLQDAISNRLLESVREEQGGSYGVGVRMSLGSTPYNSYALRLSYDTNVEQVDDLQKTIYDELQRMADEGPSLDQIAKSMEFMLKDFGNSQEYNGTWINYIEWHDRFGHDYASDYEELVRDVSADDVRRMAQTILRDHNRVETFMYPR